MSSHTIGEIARFFAFSAKRQHLFDRVMYMIHPPSKAKKIKDACQTRWIQRIDSYAVFLELLPALHTTFQAMVIPIQYEDFGTDWNWDGETIIKANDFLFQLQSSSFLICFKILLEIFHNLRSLTIKLHMQAIQGWIQEFSKGVFLLIRWAWHHRKSDQFPVVARAFFPSSIFYLPFPTSIE